MPYSFFKNRIIGNFIFIAVFTGLFFLYGLNETMFYPPQSLHIWRQTNSLSLTQNYYQYNLPFFQPEIHNQFCDEGYSGKAAGEFPVIYYTVAQLWKVFGKHEWIFKLVHLIILFSGLFLLFQTLNRIIDNRFWAGFLSLLVFTSPMIVFYGPNFLPDVPALSFVFIAWYFLLRFLDRRQTIFLWISAFWFCLAMLLKITSAVSFIAIGGWVVFELLVLKKEKRIFTFGWKHFMPFFVGLIPVILWYLYVEYYNRIHLGHLSFHGIWPVWNMTGDQYDRIIHALDKTYFKEFFLPYTQYLTLAAWFVLLIRIKSLKPVFRYFILVLPAGFFAQLLLWFQVLEGHDYYMINLLVVFVAVWAMFLTQLNKLNPRIKNISYGIAVLFFLWNAITCQNRVQKRYEGWKNEMYHNIKALLEIEPHFKKWGIAPDDKVISIPDYTINGTLYFMNRKGYTEFSSDFSNPETFSQRIEQGAKYLIVNDASVLSMDHLKPFTENEIGRHENIMVFELPSVTPQAE